MYVGVLLDSHLEWKYHVNDLSAKLSRAVGMLAKIRHYVSTDTLNMIYHGICSSLLQYGSQIWGQSNSVISKMEKLQNRALRIINFEGFRASSDPLYIKSKILKFADNIKLSNFLFAHACLQGTVPNSLKDTIKLVRMNHSQISRSQLDNQVNIPAVRTVTSGSNSIKSKSAYAWNEINRLFLSDKLIHKGAKFCKKISKKHFLESYSS